MTTQNAWRAAAQLRTLPTATRRGDVWTSKDIEFLLEFDDETAEELAKALGRTEYAILGVRQLLRSGATVGGGASRQTRREEPTYTFLDGDCPPGWND